MLKILDVLRGAQMLFVAFGALVLVPLLTGLDPSVALFTAGAGTLLFHMVTGRQIPIFLGSSFAFIAPIIAGKELWGVEATMGGLLCAGIMYIVVSGVVAWRGRDVLARILPPIVTGPVIIVIGLSLAPVAVNMAVGRTGDGSAALHDQFPSLIAAGAALLGAVLVSLLTKGWLRLVPILAGILVGSIVGGLLGLLDFSPLVSAPWLSTPDFVFPHFRWEAILFIVPVAIAPMVEHFGDIVAIGSVTGRDYLRQPGVHRTLAGDGLATVLASALGGPPNTTYSEVTGAVALTKDVSVSTMMHAAGIAIFLAFVGKLRVLLQLIPSPVMGGLLLLLFGSIAAVGMASLIRAKVDVLQPRNTIVVALILTCGLGGMSLEAGGIALKGVGLAALLGIALNLCLPRDPTSHKVN